MRTGSGIGKGTKQSAARATLCRNFSALLAAATWLVVPACDESEPAVGGPNRDAAVPDAASPDRVSDGPGSGDGGQGDAGDVGPLTTSTLTILHTNDLHSHLWGHSPEVDYTPATLNDDATVGGFARLAAAIKTERASAGQDVLLLDGGDFLMGTLFQLAATSKAPELKLMQGLGYDAATLGNHEFDFTPVGLAAVVSAARTEGVTFPLLATNMKFSDSAPQDDALAALRTETGPIRTKLVKTLPGGLKIGLFGLLGEDAQRFAAPARPVTFDPIVTTATAMVNELRNTDKVDLVVALSHSGINAQGMGEDRTLAMMVPGIDVIVSGHTHAKLDAPVQVGKTIIVTAGSYGQYLGRLDLEVDRRGAAVSAVRVKAGKLVPIDDKVLGDAPTQTAVEAYVAGLDAALAPAGLAYKKPIVETTFDVKRASVAESPLGDLVADAYLNAANALEPGEPTDIAVEANGQLRADLLKGKSGVLWFSDAFQVAPIGIGQDQQPGWPLITYYLNGPDLKAGLEVGAGAEVLGDVYFLQVAGIEVDYKASNLLFQRVTGARIVKEGMAPQPIDFANATKCYKLTSTYYVASFLALVQTLTGGALSATPKQSDCQTVVTDLFSRRLDANPGMAGVQELKQYQAVLQLLTSLPDTDADMLPNMPDRYMAAQQRLKRTP
jgi:5'-nucleotidase / UDP-sugar diphosphatase